MNLFKGVTVALLTAILLCAVFSSCSRDSLTKDEKEDLRTVAEFIRTSQQKLEDNKKIERQKTEEATGAIKKIGSALERFKSDIGRYPTTEEDTKALHTPPKSIPDETRWKGPYFGEENIPKDPWGNPYLYSYPGMRSPKQCDLWSMGPDEISDTDDDIKNWE